MTSDADRRHDARARGRPRARARGRPPAPDPVPRRGREDPRPRAPPDEHQPALAEPTRTSAADVPRRVVRRRLVRRVGRALPHRSRRRAGRKHVPRSRRPLAWPLGLGRGNGRRRDGHHRPETVHRRVTVSDGEVGDGPPRQPRCRLPPPAHEPRHPSGPVRLEPARRPRDRAGFADPPARRGARRRSRSAGPIRRDAGGSPLAAPRRPRSGRGASGRNGGDGMALHRRAERRLVCGHPSRRGRSACGSRSTRSCSGRPGSGGLRGVARPLRPSHRALHEPAGRARAERGRRNCLLAQPGDAIETSVTATIVEGSGHGPATIVPAGPPDAVLPARYWR